MIEMNVFSLYTQFYHSQPFSNKNNLIAAIGK